MRSWIDGRRATLVAALQLLAFAVVPAVHAESSTTIAPQLAQATRPAPAATAGEREALLVEGKKTLRQRVLTKPGAILRPNAGDAAPAGARPLNPLTPMFVYARRAAPGNPATWLELGPASRGQAGGWVLESETIAWKHTMTAVFHNPANRQRTLFFKDRDGLVAMLGGNRIGEEIRELLATAERRPTPADFPVVAAEPATHVDLRRQFYLLPILEAEELTFQDGREFRIVEVASVPLPSDDAPPPPPTQDFNIGIAFVIDTTMSMDPYIERVRENLNRVVRELAAAEGGKRVRFAVIGYRNSLTAQPRLEYLTRVFARFEDSANPAEFARRFAEMKATNVDSLSFNEDSFAAIRSTLNELDWSPFAARAIVLVTDAGSRMDRFSETGLDAEGIRELARQREVKILAMHLRTPQGRSTHSFAERQYRTLSTEPNIEQPFYFPVENGDVGAFAEQSKRITEALTKLVAAARPGAPPPTPGSSVDDRVAVLGHVMRLAWLGRREGARAPDVVRGWAADAYERGRDNFDVRVLLTRNQLSDLAAALKAIIDEARANALNADAVFERLRTVAAHLARDPQQLRARGLENLGQLLGEYLDGLPYQSDIMALDRATWRSWQGARQTEFIDTMESRLRAYQEFNANPDLWIKFDGGRNPGEAMYPVPLSLLP